MSAEQTAPPTICEYCKHPGIKARGKYGIGGWFALLYGISVVPKAVEYVCEKCGRVNGKTKDLETRKAHR